MAPVAALRTGRPLFLVVHCVRFAEMHSGRGGRDLRDVEEAPGRAVPQGVPLQRHQQGRVPRRQGEAQNTTSWAVRLQVSVLFIYSPCLIV